MMKDDLLDALHLWVLGACYLHNARVTTFAQFATPFDAEPLDHKSDEYAEKERVRCADWFSRVYGVVVDAVLHGTSPTGKHSDFEAELMLKAKRVFGVHSPSHTHMEN